MSDMVPEVLNAALDSLFTPKEPGELEYQGDDGLLYCRNCHTPVQCRVKLWGRDKIVPCLCRCQQEAMAEKKRQDELVERQRKIRQLKATGIQEKHLLERDKIVPCLCRCQQEAMAEKKRQDELVERQRKIRQLKATGIQEKHLLEWNFGVAEDNKDIQMAKRYVEQWKKVMERQRKIRQLKATGIQEKHLLEWNFGVAEDNKDIQMAKRYVEQWKKVKAENLGLLLWGDVGTGKSFVAACIANALLDQGIPVLMTNFSKILNQMGAMYSEERYRYIASFSNYSLLILDDLGIERSTEYALEQVYAVIDSFSNYSLLILDDLGIERSTEYALEQVYAVIDERYKSGLPVIITTNLKIAEIRNPQDVAYARIYSRILEMCTPVRISGEDASGHYHNQSENCRNPQSAGCGIRPDLQQDSGNVYAGANQRRGPQKKHWKRKTAGR